MGRQLLFSPEIATTTLRPDLMLWSPSLKKVYIIELTVSWEDSIDEAYERKHLRYAKLAAEAQHCGWNTEVCPVEVWRRGLLATSTPTTAEGTGNQRQGLNHQSCSGEAASGSV